MNDLQDANCTDSVQNFCMVLSVPEPVALRLRDLRLSAVPPLSIRGIADRLEMGHSGYAYFENPRRFKKAHLPVAFARKIASVLSGYGVDAAEVMKLAGFDATLAEEEARMIEVRRSVQYVSLPVALPNEGALVEMFEGLLAFVPDGASKAEAARILARQLPTGFAAIAQRVHAEGSVKAVEGEEAAPAPATDYREPGPSSRI